MFISQPFEELFIVSLVVPISSTTLSRDILASYIHSKRIMEYQIMLFLCDFGLFWAILANFRLSWAILGYLDQFLAIFWNYLGGHKQTDRHLSHYI